MENTLDSPSDSDNDPGTRLQKKRIRKAASLPDLECAGAGARFQQPAKKKTKLYSRLTCLRCRMLGLKCAWEEKSCSLCKQNNTQCMYLPETRSGRLIDTPKHANVVGRISEHSYHRSIQPWMLLNASHEFLSEKSGMVREPEDLSQMKENPARLWPEDCEPHMFLSSPFAQALEEFPDDESQDLPLPSSDLLRTISNTISRAEAQDSKLEAADYSESMNGSSLLALGVLLQEYTRYLL